MTHQDNSPSAELDLSEIRRLSSARGAGNTPITRTASLLQYLLETSVQSSSEDDPIHGLVDYLPETDHFPEWVEEHNAEIENLKRENPKEKFSDRYYLEQETEEFRTSSWLSLSAEACRRISLDNELLRANIAIKLMYQRASMDQADAASSPLAPIESLGANANPNTAA